MAASTKATPLGLGLCTGALAVMVLGTFGGMAVTYLGVSGGAAAWLTGFLWFRVFDILKPLGVRRLEKLGGGGGLGIMADDLGAGLLAWLATHFTIRLMGWTL